MKKKLVDTISGVLVVAGLVWLMFVAGAADSNAIGCGEILREGFAGIAIILDGAFINYIGEGGMYV